MEVRRLMIAAWLLALGCTLPIAMAASAPSAKDGAYDVLVRGLHCQACVDKATTALRKVPGVEAVTIELETGVGHLEIAHDVDPEVLRAVIAAVDLELLFAGEEVVEALPAEERATLDIATATVGKKIDLKDHLAKDKYTIFDFTAEWCAPCRLLSPKLERMVQARTDVALRFVDIVDWKSDMAKHATKEFHLQGLPYVRVYGPDGEFLGEALGLRPDRVIELISPKVEAAQ